MKRPLVVGITALALGMSVNPAIATKRVNEGGGSTPSAGSTGGGSGRVREVPRSERTGTATEKQKEHSSGGGGGKTTGGDKVVVGGTEKPTHGTYDKSGKMTKK